MNFERRSEHIRNDKLEELLQEINGLLNPLESCLTSSFEKTKYPILLIMGCARSGTTLMLQWLGSSGYFSYPTNILSRFYGAPYIGAKIQLMLTKHDFNDEIFDFNEEIPFVSSLGKTKGALAPNEFWYFWRRYFHYGDIQYLNDVELNEIDYRSFISEVAAIESVFDRPFAMKGMIVNWNIPFIADILQKVIFIYMERHPFYNIQSLLEARKKYYGNINAWYSFKPIEYTSLKDRDPYEQVAGQVYYTNRAIKEGLSKIDNAKVLTVCYEDLCQNPEVAFGKIIDKLQIQGVDADWPYNGTALFENTNRILASDEEKEKIISAYNNISGETLKL